MSDPNEISLDLDEHHIEQNDTQQDDQNAEMAKLMGFSSFTTTARTRRPRPPSVSDERPPCKKSRSDEGPATAQVLDGIHPISPKLAQPRLSCSSIIVTTDINIDISPSPTDQKQGALANWVGSPTITATRVDQDGEGHDAPADGDKGDQGQPQQSSESGPRGAPSDRGRSNFNQRGGRGGARGGRGGGHNPDWYIGYYDSRSNENPWEPLEKKKGLEPVGTWLERKPYQPRVGERQQQENEQQQPQPGQQPDQQSENTKNNKEAEEEAPATIPEAKAEVFMAAAT
ncbi:hypothetical protein QBC40DRAFT_270692 [Triangularia verruculosa]|uniref:Uncharacterized protein n=1 Tax=Triangularia verruculosa TaxID=2587418 RepID=A0AAN7B0F3_9PEZI|nr:hypothetical protein QBC40DRAFT_270692 [Triangularia verruculosa]